MIVLVQLLCEKRHCIMANVHDTTKLEDVQTKFEQIVQGLITKKVLNPWCALCNSRNWHYETAPTHFKSVEEALPVMEAMQAEQMKIREKILTERN